MPASKRPHTDAINRRFRFDAAEARRQAEKAIEAPGDTWIDFGNDNLDNGYISAAQTKEGDSLGPGLGVALRRKGPRKSGAFFCVS